MGNFNQVFSLTIEDISVSMIDIFNIVTLRLIRSTCLFWFSNSEPMSMAMFRKLPIIVFTCPILSSISSSRASFVILLNKYYWVIGQKSIDQCIFFNVIPSDVTGLRSHSITVVHYSLWLVIYDFAIIVTFPCSIVFFKWGTPEIIIVDY